MYLWDLLKQYELKFTIVYDRFDEATYGERTVESLKDRYYSVARIILEHRRIFDHPIIKSGYNYEKEIPLPAFAALLCSDFKHHSTESLSASVGAYPRWRTLCI